MQWYTTSPIMVRSATTHPDGFYSLFVAQSVIYVVISETCALERFSVNEIAFYCSLGVIGKAAQSIDHSCFAIRISRRRCTSWIVLQKKKQHKLQENRKMRFITMSRWRLYGHIVGVDLSQDHSHAWQTTPPDDDDDDDDDDDAPTCMRRFNLLRLRRMHEMRTILRSTFVTRAGGAKTAEPGRINVLFGVEILGGPKHIALDGGPHPTTSRERGSMRPLSNYFGQLFSTMIRRLYIANASPAVHVKQRRA